MTLDLTAIPLAFAAGLLSILSPCVWPLVPVVLSSAASAGRRGPMFLALGISLSFAIAGTLLSFLLLSLGLDPELFRYIAAGLLATVGLTLVIPSLANWITLHLSRMSGWFGNFGSVESGTAVGQFGVGLLLGIVWLPCVGPTLGAAIALASLGHNMIMAFTVMFAFGMATALTLLAAAWGSKAILDRVRPRALSGAKKGKLVLGWTLLALGALVLTGTDKVLEAWALQILPEWVYSL